MALTGLAIAAALSLAKDEFIDQPAANRKRKLAAATDKYAPWTGQHGQPVDDPNYGGNALIAGGTGAMIGQSIANSNATNAYKDSLTKMNNQSLAGTTPENLSQSTPATQTMSGPNPYADGGSGTMNKAFSQASLGSPQATSSPAWQTTGQGDWKFTTASPDQLGVTQNPDGSFSDPKTQALLDDPYKTLKDRGFSVSNPQDQWQINPWKGGY